MPSPRATGSAAHRLPLKPLHFLMPLSLLEGERHPYGLEKDLEAREAGRLRLGGEPA